MKVGLIMPGPSLAGKKILSHGLLPQFQNYLMKPFQPRSKINSGMPCKPNAQPNKWPWMLNAPGPKLNVQLNWFARTAVSAHRSATLAKATVPAARAAAASCVHGGRHYARDCPDRRHPSKGKGKHAFMLADPYNEHFFTGKSGKKGKGWKGRSKSAARAEHDISWISKGKGKSDHRPTVNAYVQDMYGINGLEMHEGPHNPLELSSVSLER